jgi:hypothetical protein
MLAEEKSILTENCAGDDNSRLEGIALETNCRVAKSNRKKCDKSRNDQPIG